MCFNMFLMLIRAFHAFKAHFEHNNIHLSLIYDWNLTAGQIIWDSFATLRTLPSHLHISWGWHDLSMKGFHNLLIIKTILTTIMMMTKMTVDAQEHPHHHDDDLSSRQQRLSWWWRWWWLILRNILHVPDNVRTANKKCSNQNQIMWNLFAQVINPRHHHHPHHYNHICNHLCLCRTLTRQSSTWSRTRTLASGASPLFNWLPLSTRWGWSWYTTTWQLTWRNIH